MNLSAYDKKLFWIIFIGILGLIVEVWGVSRFYTWINRSVKDISSKQKLLASSEKERLEFVALQRDYEGLRGSIPRLEAAFPEPEELADTVEQIRKLAEYTGNVQSLAVDGGLSPAEGIAGASFVSFSAELKGSYRSLRNYLQELEKAPFFMRVESVDILSSKDIAEESKINLGGKIFLK